MSTLKGLSPAVRSLVADRAFRTGRVSRGPPFLVQFLHGLARELLEEALLVTALAQRG
jgi:hypothetical protein